MTAAEAEERARLEAVKACVQRTLHALEARLDGVAQDATIQRDQNAIIRNEHAQVLIIQGVAGRARPRSRCTASPSCSTASRTR